MPTLLPQDIAFKLNKENTQRLRGAATRLKNARRVLHCGSQECHARAVPAGLPAVAGRQENGNL